MKNNLNRDMDFLILKNNQIYGKTQLFLVYLGVDPAPVSRGGGTGESFMIPQKKGQ